MATRSSERIPVYCQTMARAPASPVLVTILDISKTGCRIESDSSLLQVGGTVLLDIPGDQQAAGQVVWRKQSSFGIRFYKELSEDVFAMATEASAPATPASHFGEVPQERKFA